MIKLDGIWTDKVSLLARSSVGGGVLSFVSESHLVHALQTVSVTGLANPNTILRYNPRHTKQVLLHFHPHSHYVVAVL